MKIPFYKYQGTGNDFVLIDQREHQYLNSAMKAEIQKICDRRFGIGGDGLILLEKHPEADFEMIYFNADGNPSSMCGNGGRCIVAFAQFLKIIDSDCSFMAVDGLHDARIHPDGKVALKMADVSGIESLDEASILDTGSPHYVCFIPDAMQIDVAKEGSKIRYADTFKSEGINVNFVEDKEDRLFVATYERGVEAETLSCGTGVTAAALAFSAKTKEKLNQVDIETKGGSLQIQFKSNEDGSFTDIWLVGPATQVFQGFIKS